MLPITLRLNIAGPFAVSDGRTPPLDHATLSPLADLLADLREESAQRAAAGIRIERPRPPRRVRPPVPPRRTVEGAPELDLHLEAGVVSGARASAERPRWRWGSSIVLHTLALAAVVVLPLLRVDDLPSPIVVTKAFFVPPSLSQPPLPPAPPPRALTAQAPRIAPTAPPAAKLTAPVQRRAEITPEEMPAPAAPALEAHAEQDVPGGMDEGVPGGIVGGVIGGQAEPEAAAPSQVRVGIDVKEPRKIRDAAPVYPTVARLADGLSSIGQGAAVSHRHKEIDNEILEEGW